MSGHGPVLLVVVPLLSAPVCLLLRRPLGAWAVALGASALALGVAVALLAQVLAGGTVRYDLGGWAAPWGIEYVVDAVGAFVALVVVAIATLVLVYAPRSVAGELDAARLPLFYTAWLLCLAGLLGITVTGDVFNLFVFLEIASLSQYMLIALGRDRRALTAAFRYLVMGTIAATFILIGVGLLYMMTGTLNMADLAGRLPAVSGTRTVRAAFAFLTVGIGLKLALFPLHLWLPNAYAYAPAAVSAFIAATSTKVAAYVLLRFCYSVFGPAFAFGEMPTGPLLLGLALAAVLSASLTAVFQDDVKRLLGYSSVAQVGYIVFGLALASVTGLTAAIVHLANHALMKGALFLALGCVVYRVGSARLEAFVGLGRAMPWTMAAFVAAGLSLVGMPLTAGFVSKWYLVLAALERGWWWAAAVVLAGSLLAAVYLWRVVEAAYFRPAGRHVARVTEAPAALLLPTWVLVVANYYFGLDTDLTVGVAGHAAGLLLGGGG